MRVAGVEWTARQAADRFQLDFREFALFRLLGAFSW
jgi:hypothetical protein